MKKIGKKILTGVLILFLAGVIVLIAGTWNMFGDKIRAAQSVKKLDENLYYMEYKGDYGLDGYLNQGGASSADEMAAYIMKFLSGGFYGQPEEMSAGQFGCTAYTVDTAEGGCLMGRNYDWGGENGVAMIVHTKPENGYSSYSTCWIEFLGFGEGWKPEGMREQYMSLASIYVPLDGMNEKGLCVADLMVGDNEQTDQNTDKADLTTTSAIRLLLDRAATVEEAVKLLEEYDMHSDIGRGHHLAISDASGRSVVVEYIGNIMYVTDTPLVTNHYLTEGEKYGVGSEESHVRFDRVMDQEKASGGIMDVSGIKSLMQDVSYENETQWTIIYDMTRKSMDFYWQRKYDSPIRFENF